MDIKFNYQHVSGSVRLEEYTEQRLLKVFKRYSWVTRADVFFTAEQTESPETGMKVGIRLSAPGPRLFAEESHSTFTSAVSAVVNQLLSQCEQRKSEIINHA